MYVGYQLNPFEYDDAPDIEPQKLPEGIADLDEARAKRGPKPKIFANTHAPYIQIAHAERQHWLDDFVHGACATSGGVSNGKLNVSPQDILRVCMLPEISTATVKATIRTQGLQEMSDVQARRIARVARFATDGIGLYMERHTQIKTSLQGELDFIAAYQQHFTADMAA
ncbi:hypothetical protein D3C73_1110680 [compost metagenome]